VWTLGLLKSVTRPDQIFWKINHDNNHFLNSLWMYALGPYRPSLLYRAPSIVCGTLSVVAAGYWGLRRGRFVAVAAMLLFASSYMLVDLGSQARGYSAMILCIVLGMILAEEAINGKPKPLRLGLVILAGTLSHILMIFSAIALALWVFFIKVNRLKNIRLTHKFIIDLFLPAVCMIMPIGLWIGALIDQQKFVIGGIEPVNFFDFLNSYGQAIKFSLLAFGPDKLYGLYAVAASIAYFRIVRSDRSVLYMILIIAVPVIMLEAHMPNIKMARYFVPCGIAAIMVCAEMAGRLWRCPAIFPKTAAVMIVIFFMIGNARSLNHFFHTGRGSYRAALNYIAQEGPTSFTGNYTQSPPFVELYYIDRLHLPLTYVPKADWCAAPTPWLILHFAADQTPPPTVSFGEPDCAHSFDRPRIFSNPGPSAIGWVVYRRAS
jgi:hypothetical protein